MDWYLITIFFGGLFLANGGATVIAIALAKAFGKIHGGARLGE